MPDTPIARFFEVRGAYPECEEGWHQLIIDLDEQLSHIEPRYKVDQVKEKFGGLRFYYDWMSVNEDNREAVENLITAAEQRAYTICEACGASNSTVATGGTQWVKTLCADHRVT